MKKLLLSVLALSSSALAFNLETPKSYSVKYTHNFARLDGFVQIPKGGQFGTTSEKRPEFNELGIGSISYPELFLGAKWDKFSVYSEIKYLTFKGNAILKSDLKTHDIDLKKGDKISSKHLYAFYRLGFGYDFNLVENLTVTPKIEMSLFDFSYKFSAIGRTTNIKDDERSFRAGTVRVGGLVNYKFNNDFALNFDLMTHIPHDSIKYSLETSLMASYNLYRNENKELNLLGGVAYDMFKYRDTQRDMQNFMYLKSKPVYKLGLELKF